MLVEMMKKMSTEQGEASDQAKKDTNLVIERVDTIEKRLDKLENGGAAQGESAFIEQHKNMITKSRYGIKILNMRM